MERRYSDSENGNDIITSPYLLVVEGKDEKNLFSSLLDSIGIKDVQILDIGGKDKIHNQLKSLLKWSNLRL